MKSLLFTLIWLLSVNVYAEGAKIIATDTDNNNIKVNVALDSEQLPRIEGDSKSYPSIKYFRDDSRMVDFCYEGKQEEVKALLTALVDAANGDGDSWSELKSIKLNSQSAFTVVVKIEDESGEYEEEYKFSPCEKTSTAVSIKLLGKLPKSSLSKLINNLAVEWGDNNISTGTSQMAGAIFQKDIPKTASAWRLIALALFEDELNEISQVNKKVKDDAIISLSSNKYNSKKHIEETARALALGNAYDDSKQKSFTAFREGLEKVLKLLGNPDQLQTLKAKTKLKSSVTGSVKEVIYFAFLNKETKNVVTIFVVEGTI